MKRLSFLIIFLNFSLLAESKPKDVRVVIFVHGTLKPPQLSFTTLMQIMRDKVDNTFYSKAALYMRDDPHFYFTQAIQERGLKQVDLSPEATPTAAKTIALMYNFQLEALGKAKEPILYYTLGWNGLLSDTKRFEEAEFFYGELLRLVAKLKEQNLNPHITIIAYSHGANVLFYLPKVRETNPLYKNTNLNVDKLVALATPIQPETDYLTADSMFKKIYHLYSTQDPIQVMDFFSSRNFLSQRKFFSRKSFKLPEHLQQIRIRTVKKVKRKHKAKNIDTAHEVLKHPKVKLIRKDPSHTEMWNFKNGSYWYRDDFPLYPLPVMAFVPTILDSVDKYPEIKDLTVEYAPSENALLLHNRKARIKETSAFLSPEAQKDLWKLEKAHRPRSYSFKALQKRVKKAIDKTKQDQERKEEYKRPHHRTLVKYINDHVKKENLRLAKFY